MEQGYIKEVITFYRPANAGRKYLNTKDWNFEGKPNGDYYIVNEKFEEVKEIKKELQNKISCSELAIKYNVQVACISKIKLGRTWKHV